MHNRPNSPIILALDFHNESQVMAIVDRLSPQQCKLKVGQELFLSNGRPIIEKLISKGFDVFLDLKFHDIPNTIYKASMQAANMGIWMFNIHAMGGLDMMVAAKAGIDDVVSLSGGRRPLLTAVTVLTSLNQDDLSSVGVNTDLDEQVITLARMAMVAGLDGVVCPAIEAKRIKQSVGQGFITVSPGIRLNDSPQTDQKLIMTPHEAVKNCVDYIVMGRAITTCPDPVMTIEDILHSIQD